MKNIWETCYRERTYTVDPISKRRLPNNGEEDKFYVEGHHEPLYHERFLTKHRNCEYQEM